MADSINYKPLIFRKMQELAEKCPDFSMGQIIMCAYRYQAEPYKIEGPMDLLGLPDEDLYSALERATYIEEPEN